MCVYVYMPFPLFSTAAVTGVPTQVTTRRSADYSVHDPGRALPPLRTRSAPAYWRARPRAQRASERRATRPQQTGVKPVLPMSDDPERARWTRWWVVGLQMERSEVRGIGWDKACSRVRAL